MTRSLACVLLLPFAACVGSTYSLPTPAYDAARYEVVGDASTTTTGIMLLQLIPIGQNDKIQLGVAPLLPATPPAQVPALPDGIVPPLLPGLRQTSGRAARTGDAIKIIVDQTVVQNFIAGMAAVAAGAPVTPFDMTGCIASGSDIVEVE